MVQRIRTCPNPAKWLRKIERFTAPDGDCWRWIGPFNDSGYGLFSIRDGGRRCSTGAHRASWLAHRGDIPDDLVIDHLCRNRWCVNPWHLELVTSQINIRRRPLSEGYVQIRPTRPRRKKDDDLRACSVHGREDGFVATWGGYTRWACNICRRARHRQEYLSSKTK